MQTSVPPLPQPGSEDMAGVQGMHVEEVKRKRLSYMTNP